MKNILLRRSTRKSRFKKNFPRNGKFLKISLLLLRHNRKPGFRLFWKNTQTEKIVNLPNISPNTCFFYKHNVYKHTETWIWLKNKHIRSILLSLLLRCVKVEKSVFLIFLIDGKEYKRKTQPSFTTFLKNLCVVIDLFFILMYSNRQILEKSKNGIFRKNKHMINIIWAWV